MLFVVMTKKKNLQFYNSILQTLLIQSDVQHKQQCSTGVVFYFHRFLVNAAFTGAGRPLFPAITVPSSLSSTRLAVCCATVTLVQLCPVTDPDPDRCLSLPPPPGGDVTGVAQRHRPPDPASWDSSSHCVCPLGSGEAGLLHLFGGNLEGTTSGRLRMSPGFSTAARHAATSQPTVKRDGAVVV